MNIILRTTLSWKGSSVAKSGCRLTVKEIDLLLFVCRLSMTIGSAFLALSAALYLAAKLLSHSQPDYRQREPSDEVSSEEPREPLLAEAGS